MSLPLTPDGVFYKQAAQGKEVPTPYALRVFWPTVLKGESDKFWIYAYWGGLALLALGTALYAGSLLAIPLVLLGPCMWFYSRRKVLVDIPALGLMMAGVSLWQYSETTGLLLILLGASWNEKVPIFAAIALWDFAPLLALIIPAVMWLLAGREKWEMPPQLVDAGMGEEMRFVLTSKPWRVGWETHKDTLTDPTKWLLPLGGLLLIWLNPTWASLAALATALVMAFLATDSVRMYTWAMPVLVVNVILLGWPLAVLAIILSWFASTTPQVRRWV